MASRNCPLSNDTSRPRFTASRMYCTATAPSAPAPPPAARASAISSAAGTTRLTRPICSASSAVTCRPVSSRSSATPLPTSRGSRCVPPYPGMMPRLISGWPSRAVSAAMRSVQAIASSQPPPSAKPLMAAMTGLPMFSIRSKTCWPRSACSLPCAGRLHRQLVDVGAGDERLLAGAGDDDARTAASCFSSSTARRSSSMVGVLSALRTCGRLMVTNGDGAVALEQEVLKASSREAPRCEVRGGVENYTPRPAGDRARAIAPAASAEVVRAPRVRPGTNV